MAKVPSVPALTVGDARDAVRRFGRAPRTIGVPVLPPDTSEAEWLAQRKTMLCASEVAAVFGRSPYASAFSLWWRKQPDWPGEPETANQHIGRKLEAVIGELWAEENPDAALYRPGAALWAHHKHRWLGATPDYLGVWPTENSGVRFEPVECKSDEGGDGWGRALTAEVPFPYLCQSLVQQLVMGVDCGRIFRLSGKRTTEYVIFRADHRRLCDDIIHAGATFVASLELHVPPEVDGHPATETALKTLHGNVAKGTEEIIPDELADVFEEASLAVKAWEARLSDARNRIRERMGRANAQYGVRPDGRRVVVRSIFKRNGYTVEPSEVDMIRRVK